MTFQLLPLFQELGNLLICLGMVPMALAFVLRSIDLTDFPSKKSNSSITENQDIRKLRLNEIRATLSKEQNAYTPGEIDRYYKNRLLMAINFWIGGILVIIGLIMRLLSYITTL